jgi:amino acid adenylation domain-containing protein
MTASARTATLSELIAAQVARTPDVTAVTAHDGSLTYAQLDRRAGQIAEALAGLGVWPDSAVGVLMGRSADLVAALLAVLRAGGAYLPLETEHPLARNADLLAAAGARVCLTEPHLAETMRDTGVAVLQPADLDPADAPASGPGPSASCAANLCAVYFTSGSTGRPKAVGCTHAGWVNRMRWMQRQFPLRVGEAVLHKTTLTFDDAAVEIFWPLLNGGRVVLLPPRLHLDPRAIIEASIEHQPVHVQFVPSMLDLFLDSLTDRDVTALRSLRTVLSSGEALRPGLVARFVERFGDQVRLVNTWGVTEVSIDSTCHLCGPDDGRESEPAVNLGQPIDGNSVHVLDARLEPVAEGTAGDVYLGGIGLARGYLGDPRRTADAFRPHPGGRGERIYRTGDRGLRAPDGALRFRGRQDRQVKLRGIRIELEEIDSVLRTHPAVSEAATVVRAGAAGDGQLASYVVARPGAQASPVELRDLVRSRLPEAAVPDSVTVLLSFPRLPNGKLDIHSLPDPDLEGSRETPYIAPRTPTEEALVDIWRDLLGRERVGIHDDFFRIGGHSLLATRAVTRMRRAFGTDAPLRLMFERPTIAALAPAVEEMIIGDIEELTDEEVARLAAQ